MANVLRYITATEQQYKDILAGKVDFYDVVEDEKTKYADLDHYTSDFTSYVIENNANLLDLLSFAEPVDELPVNVGVIFDKDSIKSVLKAFNETDLIEFAEEVGYPEDEEHTKVVNSFYKVLVGVKELFEYAINNNLLVLGWWF